MYFCETVREACHFETNFRLSLKQMYDGDRLSKQETSVLPKTTASFNENQSVISTSAETMDHSSIIDIVNFYGLNKCH